MTLWDNLKGDLTWETKRGKKRHTHTHTTKSGTSAKDVEGQILSSSAQGVGLVGWYFIQKGHTHVRWQVPQRLCIQRQARSVQTDENDLKQRVIYTTHPPHKTKRLEFYSSFCLKMQRHRGPRPKENRQVNALSLLEIKATATFQVHFDKLSQRLTTRSWQEDFNCTRTGLVLRVLWRKV